MSVLARSDQSRYHPRPIPIMSDNTDASSIRFYFSFRSPYAWLAAERLDAELGARRAAHSPTT